MRTATLTVVALLALAFPAFGQANMQIAATAAKTETPQTWRLTGTVTNAGTSQGTMVYARYYGHPIPGTGPTPAMVGGVWVGSYVKADGTFTLDFTTADTGFTLEVYTFTESIADRRPPARIAVAIP